MKAKLAHPTHKVTNLSVSFKPHLTLSIHENLSILT